MRSLCRPGTGTAKKPIFFGRRSGFLPYRYLFSSVWIRFGACELVAVVPFLSFALSHSHAAHVMRRRVLSFLPGRRFFHLCQLPCHSVLSSSCPVVARPPRSSCPAPSFFYCPFSFSVLSVSLIHPDCATAAGFHVVFPCWCPYATAAGYPAPVATASG